MDDQNDDAYKRARQSAAIAAAEKPAAVSGKPAGDTTDKPKGSPASADTKSADKTPLEWKELLRTPAYEFSPAELLHDWHAHALHANSGKLMSRAVYQKAIKAASAPNEHGDYTPVPEAQGDFLADGKPRAIAGDESTQTATNR